jgi:hypothetical protein
MFGVPRRGLRTSRIFTVRITVAVAQCADSFNKVLAAAEDLLKT